MRELIEIVGEENSTDELEELVLYGYDTSVNIPRPNGAVRIPMGRAGCSR